MKSCFIVVLGAENFHLPTHFIPANNSFSASLYKTLLHLRSNTASVEHKKGNGEKLYFSFSLVAVVLYI